MEKVFATVDEIEHLLVALRERAPELVQLEAIGKSVEGRDLTLAVVTDRQVDDEDKQVALLMSGQHGDEHRSVAMMAGVLEWLLTDEAAEIRRKQIVLVLPLLNVDSYEVYRHKNKNNVDLYRNYMLETVEPERIAPPQPASIYKETLRVITTQPESTAIWKVAEKYRPEVVVDAHGSPPGEYDPMVYGPNLSGYDGCFRDETPDVAPQVPGLLSPLPIVDPVPVRGRDRGEILECCSNMFHSWGLGMHRSGGTRRFSRSVYVDPTLDSV